MTRKFRPTRLFGLSRWHWERLAFSVYFDELPPVGAGFRDHTRRDYWEKFI